jgi:hypothetical protein
MEKHMNRTFSMDIQYYLTRLLKSDSFMDCIFSSSYTGIEEFQSVFPGSLLICYWDYLYW